MNTRLVAILTVFCLLPAASQTRAQGVGWQAGPLDNGRAPNGTNGNVFASTLWDPDGSGPLGPTLVAAGLFTTIEGVPALHIAVRNAVTGRWQPLGSGIPTNLYALTVFNGQLVAGGFGDNNPNTLDNDILRWNGSSWQSLNGGTSSGYVTSLTVYNGDLYAAGHFVMNPATSPIYNIARWNAATGLWEGVPGGPADNQGEDVRCLWQYNGDLIAGTYYYDTAPHGHVWRWNSGSGWQSIASCNQGVECLAGFNGELIAGGVFDVIGTASVPRIAGWNGTFWHNFGSGINDAGVFGLAVYNSQLVAGGSFTTAGGSPGNFMAVWKGSSWQAMGSGITGAAFNGVTCLMVDYDGLIAGGLFNTADGRPANNMARWNGFEWSSFGGGSASSVLAMTNFLGRVVAGGEFHQSADPELPAHFIAGWDGATLSSFGTGMDNPVFALKTFRYPGVFGNNELIAGGSFTHAGGVAANFIARWDQNDVIYMPPAWQAMGAGFNNAVYAIERFNGATYAGGAFTFSTSGVSRIARWNETSHLWEALSTGMNGPVYALKAYNGALYAGGTFTTAGGVSTGGLARWDGVNWSWCGGFFAGAVYALEVHNGQLVIGGLYPGINSSPNLAEYDGTFYSTFGIGGTDAAVRSLHSTGPRLYIGGSFSAAGGAPASHSAYWDGAWHAVSGGTDNTVWALANYHNMVHVGGVFGTVRGGSLLSAAWARYDETGVPQFLYGPSSQTANLGDNVSFSARPDTGYSGLSLQWLRNGVPLSNGPTGSGSTLSGVNSENLNIVNVTNPDIGDYRMVVTNAWGIDSSNVATLTGPVGVDGPGSPSSTVFEALGPNPSGGATRLAFSLARPASVRVLVHDVAGRLVRVMEVGRLPAGQHQASWDARGDGGERVRAGIYLVGLEVDGHPLGVKRATILH